MGFFDTILEDIKQNAPSFLLALLVLVVGWLAARLLSRGLFVLLARTSLDDWASKRLGIKTGGKYGHRIERVAAKTLFFAVLVVVLVIVFDILEPLGGLNEPLLELVSNVLYALSNVLLAAVILLIAFVVGKLLGYGLTRLLSAVKFDQRISRLGGLSPAEERSVSSGAGTLVFWFVMVIGIIQALETLELTSLVEPLQNALNEFASVLPNLVGAGLLLLVGVIAARFAGRVSTRMLTQVGFDGFVGRLGLVRVEPAGALVRATEDDRDGPAGESGPAGGEVGATTPEDTGDGQSDAESSAGKGDGGEEDAADAGESAAVPRRTPSEVAGMVVIVVVVLLVVTQCLSILHLDQLARLLEAAIAFLPDAAIALVILAVGLWAGNWVKRRFDELYSAQDERMQRFLGSTARVGVIAFSAIMALQQLGVATEIIVSAFAILFGAVCLALALAFGLGGRDVAGEIVREQYEKQRAAEASGGAAGSGSGLEGKSTAKGRTSGGKKNGPDAA